jgi:predicted transcriptional regulator
MSVSEILREIKALPQNERLHLVEQLVKLTEADIPESFREGMAQAERGELLDFDETLKELDR